MRLLTYLRIILPALIGNVLEWYEFAIYGYFAVDIAHQFFPSADPTASLLETFSVLAIGFFMRPVGALVFGYLADRKGRKKALPVTVMLMAIATTIIGFIPTYAQIGIGSAILLVLCRMIQGFAVGGEYSSAIAYIVEQAPPNKKNLFGSLTLFGAYFGILLGSGVAASLSYLAKDTPYFHYVWRGAFILGIFLGLLGLYIRKKAPETPEFLEAKKKGQLDRNPLKALLSQNGKTLLFGIGMTLLPAVSSWLIMAYFPTYTTQYGKLESYQTLSLETLALLVIVAAIPLYGFLSDRVGRFPFLFASPILILAFSYLLFLPLLKSNLPSIFLAQSALALFYIMSEALLPSTLAAIFPTDQRCTGIALCVNIANGFFGGTAPLVATYLIQQTGNVLAPTWYLMGVALISLLSTFFIYKTHRRLAH